MKILLELDAASRDSLESQEEYGMGYHVLKARVNGEPAAPIVVVANLALPFSHQTFYSLEDLAKAVSPPHSSQTCNLTAISTPAGPATAGLPSGFLPVAGAVALLGTHTVNAPESHFRFVGSSTDSRFVSSSPGASISPGTTGTLLPGTYLASPREKSLVTSGFGAVGRFALPMPMPASHVFEYQLQASTLPANLKVGTVAPAFGQAGGGAEVKTPSKRLAVMLVMQTKNDDF